MSEIISTSVSAFAIFSAEESWGLPPKRKDILVGCGRVISGEEREEGSEKIMWG